MYNQPHPQAFGPVISRLGDVMAHTTAFAFEGSNRLAKEAGVSLASVSRLISARQNLSLRMAARLTAALERELGFHIDPRDIFAEEGAFLTRHCCDLVGCRGCLPEAAYDSLGNVLPAFADIRSGHWVTSKYPKGYTGKGGK